MGFEQNIRRSALAVALLAAATGAGAEPREPLLITELHDPTLVPLSGAGGSLDPEADLADQRVRQFASMIDQAAAAEQQANAAKCRSSKPVPAAGRERLAWEANCRYVRR